jgi:cysteinyl-tRNA synthetase
VKKSLDEMLWILGIEEVKSNLGPKGDSLEALAKELGAVGKTSDEILDSLIKMREDARKSKDYAKGDLIRDKLKEIGIVIEDKPDGTRWKVE